MFLVRPTELADVDATRELVIDSWDRAYAPLVGMQAQRDVSLAKHTNGLFEDEIADSDGFSFIAVAADGEIAGHVGGRIKSGKVAFVDRLHVAPVLQGSGAAAALMDAVANLGSVAAVELTVLQGNERAIAFYAKYGFEDLGTLGPTSGFGGCEAISLRKRLA